MDEELRSMLTVIIKEIRYVKDDVQELKEGVKVLKEDVSVLKEDVKALKEDIDVLKGDVKVLKEDVDVLKEDVKVLKEDVDVLKEDVKVLKEEVKDLRDDVDNLNGEVKVLRVDVNFLKKEIKIANGRITGVALMVENDTNKNIRLLAENHINLIDKMNESIRASDKTLMYEIAVDTLKTRVNRLEKEMDKIKKAKRVTV